MESKNRGGNYLSSAIALSEVEIIIYNPNLSELIDSLFLNIISLFLI